MVVITLPVYKDARFLESSVNLIESVTPSVVRKFTLVIVEDDSDSSKIVNKLMEKYSNIVYFQHDKRQGRGRSLREAWKKVRGDVYLFMDVDLSTDLMKLDAYKNLIENVGYFDLVTGSRYVQGSVTERPWLRLFVSLVYNWLVRLLFQTGVHDHQCGFKSFSRGLVERLSEEARSDSWFWDTEVIVLAKKLGLRIREVPIYWVEKKGSRTPVMRLIKDVWLHGTGLLKLLWRVYFSHA